MFSVGLPFPTTEAIPFWVCSTQCPWLTQSPCVAGGNRLSVNVSCWSLILSDGSFSSMGSFLTLRSRSCWKLQGKPTPPTPKSPHLCVAVSSPVLCPANSGHLGLPRPLALSSQLKRTCRALLGVYLPYCGVRQWAGAIVGLALCVFPSLRNCLSFVVWNGFITIVSCILSGFLWAFCLFVYIDSGRRVNLVPVALSWWDTKVLLWFKFFSYPLLKLQQSAGHIDVSFAACFWY